MEEMCEEAIKRGSDVQSAAVSAPLAEMFAAAHDQLHGRLFNS
jgi:urease accessory protein UreF